MGCMMNTVGIGSGDKRENSAKNEIEDKPPVSMSIIRGWEIFLLWGRHNKPRVESATWKDFIGNVKKIQNLYC